jgi:imidazolonepropionase-like amidohydrolase
VTIACSRSKTAVTIVALFTAASAVALVQVRVPAPLTVVKAGRLLDVATGRYISDARIVIRGDRVAAVLSPQAAAPGDAAVIDWSGSTVLPGLIDAHVHLAWAAGQPSGTDKMAGTREAAATLNAGFTTVRNPGSDGFSDVALARAIEDGRVPGPRIVPAGPGIGTKGGVCEQVFGSEALVDRPDSAEGVIARLAARGVGVIKVCAGGGVVPDARDTQDAEMDLVTLRAIVTAAHQRRLKVAAHATTSTATLRAIEAGVDSIEHGGELTDSVIAALQRSQIFVVPTLYRLQWQLEAMQRAGNASAVAAQQAMRERILAGYRRAVTAGKVRVAFGTDATVIPHGMNAREFTTLASIGLTPLAAIQTATINAADLLGMRDRVGCLAVGCYADMIAVEGDPLTDLTVLQRVTAVVKGGKQIPR